MKTFWLVITLLSPSITIANDCIGHVFFYNFETETGDTEINADFDYYLGSMKSVLREKGITYSEHVKQGPLTAVTCFTEDMTLSNNLLESRVGIVLIKPNMKMKFLSGVMTGVDFQMAVEDFYEE